MSRAAISGVREGFTLIEVMIAVTLVSLLSVAMLFAIRIALNSEVKANTKLAANRRVVGAERVIEQELNGFMPETATWMDEKGGSRQVPFFDGHPDTMRFVSSYSLAGASRGVPQILEFAVIPGDEGAGVRLIVDELPFRGALSTGGRIGGFQQNDAGVIAPVFLPVEAGSNSFVLADRLAYCRLVYLASFQNPPHEEWVPEWVQRKWPLALRIEMAPLDADPALLHPMTVTAPIHAWRDPDRKYADAPDNH